MRHLFDLLVRFKRPASALTLIVGLAAFSAAASQNAHAQASDPAMSQIKDDAHFTAHTVGKIDGRVREVRRVAYATFALAALALLLSGYLLVRGRSAGQRLGPTNSTSPSAEAKTSAPPGITSAADADRSAWTACLNALSRWRENAALARLRKRQESLALAVARLQDFANNALANNKEMANLVATLQQEIKEVNNGLDEQAELTTRPS